MKNKIYLEKRSIPQHVFTLIELLICVAIILILMSILLPALKRTQLQAKKITCMNNEKQMGLAFNFYEGDYTRWPSPRQPDYWFHQLWPYTYNKLTFHQAWVDKTKLKNSIWTCPEFGELHPTEYALRGYGIAINLPPTIKGDNWTTKVSSCPIPLKIKKPSITVLAGDSKGLYCNVSGDYGDWHLGSCDIGSINSLFGYVHLKNANMLFCDMHVESNRKAKYLEYFAETGFDSTSSY